MEYISCDAIIWAAFCTISKEDILFRFPCTYIMFKETIQDWRLDAVDMLWGNQRSRLSGIDLTIEEFFYAQNLAGVYMALSVEDRIALAIAKERGILLLTDNRSLKNAADQEHVQTMNASELLCVMYQSGYIDEQEYRSCYRELSVYKERRRLASRTQERKEAL